MVINELSVCRSYSEKHEWHFRGDFIEDGKTIGGVDIKLDGGYYKLSDMTNMAKKIGVAYWVLECDSCRIAKMIGTFLPKKE